MAEWQQMAAGGSRGWQDCQKLRVHSRLAGRYRHQAVGGRTAVCTGTVSCVWSVAMPDALPGACPCTTPACVQPLHVLCRARLKHEQAPKEQKVCFGSLKYVCCREGICQGICNVACHVPVMWPAMGQSRGLLQGLLCPASRRGRQGRAASVQGRRCQL